MDPTLQSQIDQAMIDLDKTVNKVDIPIFHYNLLQFSRLFM